MMSTSDPGGTPSDLARTIFQLLALAILMAASVWIVRPFLMSALWAVTIVVATWPLLLQAQARMGGRRGPAVAVMTIALLLLLVLPLYFGIEAFVDNTERLAEWAKSLQTFTFPPLPEWAAALPFLGPRISTAWHQLEAARPEELATRFAPFLQRLILWFVGQVGGLGLLIVQFLLMVIIAAILYTNGETTADGVRRFTRRLAGPPGERALQLAGQAIRGVALGVLVTAILQAAAVWVGMAIVGVPFAIILSMVVFILCVAQIGALVVLLPVTVWVYSQSGPVWGTFFLIWSIFCGTFDNFLRPILIRRGADLPLLLIFAGVIGGLVAFGIIGLFIGPVVLAVAYMLLAEWVGDDTPAAAPSEPPPEAPPPEEL